MVVEMVRVLKVHLVKEHFSDQVISQQHGRHYKLENGRLPVLV